MPSQRRRKHSLRLQGYDYAQAGVPRRIHASDRYPDQRWVGRG